MRRKCSSTAGHSKRTTDVPETYQKVSKNSAPGSGPSDSLELRCVFLLCPCSVALFCCPCLQFYKRIVISTSQCFAVSLQCPCIFCQVACCVFLQCASCILSFCCVPAVELHFRHISFCVATDSLELRCVLVAVSLQCRCNCVLSCMLRCSCCKRLAF